MNRSSPTTTFGPIKTDVGDATGLIEFEGVDSYGRIAVENTPEGEPDWLVLQRPAAGSSGYETSEYLVEVGRFHSRGLSWEEIQSEMSSKASGGSSSSRKRAQLWADGGSRPNPGPGGIGVVLSGPSVDVEVSQPLGTVTNNVAEYRALLAGLRRAQRESVTSLSIRLDSELVVKQVQGEYSVSDNDLQSLRQRVHALLDGFEHWDIKHVPRSENKRADELASNAIPG